MHLTTEHPPMKTLDDLNAALAALEARMNDTSDLAALTAAAHECDPRTQLAVPSDALPELRAPRRAPRVAPPSTYFLRA